ncbi:MAG: hypothetical protein ACFFG0_12280 [Candidatus Thorarchaeota archaeon]
MPVFEYSWLNHGSKELSTYFFLNDLKKWKKENKLDDNYTVNMLIKDVSKKLKSLQDKCAFCLKLESEGKQL